MSLFDMVKSAAQQAGLGDVSQVSQIVAELAGQLPGESGKAVAGFGSLMEQVGGLNGLKEKFEAQGAGHLIQSWIGSGQNLPIDANQLANVLGPQLLGGIAQKLGIDAAAFQQILAQFLPTAIDQLSKGNSFSLDKLTGFLPKN